MALLFAHLVIFCINFTVQSGLQSPISDQQTTRPKNDNISTAKTIQTRGFESSRHITVPPEVIVTDTTPIVYYNMSHFTNYEIVGQWSRLCEVTKKTEELNVFTINCTVSVNSNLTVYIKVIIRDFNRSFCCLCWWRHQFPVAVQSWKVATNSC